MVDKKVQRIKLIVAITVVIAIAVAIIIRVNIYNKNGEKNMPFSISKIIIMSTAKKYGEENAEPVEGTESIWNFDVVQNNDVYIQIDDNSNGVEQIKSVTIDNIEVTEPPQKGILRAYMPNSMEGARYTYADDYEVHGSLTYRGAESNSFSNLQINRNGGIVSISFANRELGRYSSGDDIEVIYDGRMLSKLGVTEEDIKSKVAFNITIELESGKKYYGRLALDMNCTNIVQEGVNKLELTDFSDIVFKRM